MKKSQAGNTTWLFGRNSPNWKYAVLDLFPHRCWSWSDDLLVLCTSSKSQSGDQNGHDHDHFQKFQSISPPFVAGCSGPFRRRTKEKQCFSSTFLSRHKLAGRFILR